VSATEKGSLLVFSKVELRWTEGAPAVYTLAQDTFIDLANDHPEDVQVQMYFINGDPPLAAAPSLNDLVVQRYAAGSRGITPHRDHVRYRNLVAIVTLAGQARFFVCRERSGTDAREVAIPPGSLLLMRAPGFAGRSDRPFHFLSDVTSTRVCVGIRHDVQADTPD
jgi:alkylated DNA repair dioxygenase AlkB